FKPKYRITDKTANNLTKIERVRGFLEAAQLKDSWVAGMQSHALIIESHHSTHIEGTELTLEQAKEILADKRVEGVKEKDEVELKNYRAALEAISQQLGKEEPIIEDQIKEIHQTIVKGVRGGEYTPGEYRTTQNYIINSATGEIIYTPPKAAFVKDLMKELVEWINQPKDISPIILASIAQFQFVHIHPFADGNGRTARLLSTLVLYKTGYDFKRLFSLSEYYDRDKPSYYNAIQSVRENNMDLTGWLEYFTEGLKTQLTEVQEKGKLVITKEALVEKAKDFKLNERQQRILLYLVEEKRASVEEIRQRFNFVRRTVQRDFSKLVELGFVKEIAKSKTDPTRYYELL
ncbi:MAG: Fic family protein, partial [Candidatus Hydrothermarchaeales archaeon]